MKLKRTATRRSGSYKSVLEDPFTPEEKLSLKPAKNRKITSSLEGDLNKIIAARIKTRTQNLQERILDGYLGVDDTDPYRVTRLIKKLIVHKPDLAIRLLAKLLPTLSDADLQKNVPQAQATINIINQNNIPQDILLPKDQLYTQSQPSYTNNKPRLMLDANILSETDLDSEPDIIDVD